MLNNIISKAFCINLEYRYDRWYQAREMFAHHQLNVERFTAIDGREMKEHDGVITKGAAGCILSHYSLIERSLLMGFKAVLIFEDDAELHPEFNTLINECLQDLPAEWDMLMLGGSHWQPPERINDRISRVRHTLTSHAYILRCSLYPELIKRLITFTQPVDGVFTEVQKTHGIYVTNPPLAWQRGGWSDIEGREMHYDHLKSNEQ
jgi:GR25 family glycosyltransferase involved in LPS biosynthesis